MPKKTYDLIELIRRKASMSAEIVEKDKDYGLYSGASYTTARTMAQIDVLLKLDILPPRINGLLKISRMFLNQDRKAFFASVGSTEITKLGFIQGLKQERIDAT